MTLATNKINGDDIDATEWNEAATAANKVTNGTLVATDISDFDSAVDSAGATMNTDADVSANTWVLDEDDMNSDSATKVPTQQSVKAYVDANITSGTYKGVNKTISNSNTDADYYCDGTDDYVQFQAAIDAINTAGGGNLIVDNTGTAYVKGSTDIEWKSNVWMDANGAQFTNGSSGSLFESTADLDNVVIKNVHVNATTSTSYIFNFTGDCTNMVFEGNVFASTAGRAIHCGGSFIARKNVGKDCWAGIGTKDYKSVTSPDPTIIIEDNYFENVSHTTGTESEGIEVNTHNVGHAVVTGNVIKGFRENGIDCNITNYVVSNNLIVMDDTFTSSNTGLVVNVSTVPAVNPSGIMANNVITNVGSYGTGIYADFHDGLFVGNNVVIGSNSGTPVGYGMNISGGAGNICVVQGAYFQDLAIGLRSDINELLMVTNDVYVNCTTNNDNGSGGDMKPLSRLGQEAFYNTTDSAMTFFDAAQVAVATGTAPFLVSRHSNESQEYLSIQVDDTNADLKHNQDETTGTHRIRQTIESDTTGDRVHLFRVADQDGSNVVELGGFTNIDAGSSGYQRCLLLNGYYLWVDSTGDLRIKSSEPTSDADGTVVGTQS